MRCSSVEKAHGRSLEGLFVVHTLSRVADHIELSCCRASAIMSRSTRRGPWLPNEDLALIELVRITGPHNWVRIAQQLQDRSPKQCRERYHQNLKANLNHDPISPREGEVIEQLVQEVGKRWAEIARRLGNRSDNAVKNWYNGSMNRRRRRLPQHHNGRQLDPRFFTTPSTLAQQRSRSKKVPHSATLLPRHDAVHPAWPLPSNSTACPAFDAQAAADQSTQSALQEKVDMIHPRVKAGSSWVSHRQTFELQSQDLHHNGYLPSIHTITQHDPQTQINIVSPALSEVSYTSSLQTPSLSSDTSSVSINSPGLTINPHSYDINSACSSAHLERSLSSHDLQRYKLSTANQSCLPYEQTYFPPQHQHHHHMIESHRTLHLQIPTPVQPTRLQQKENHSRDDRMRLSNLLQ